MNQAQQLYSQGWTIKAIKESTSLTYHQLSLMLVEEIAIAYLDSRGDGWDSSTRNARVKELYQAGVSQRQIAERVGLSQGHVCSLLSGDS